MELHGKYKDLIDNTHEKKVNKLIVLVHINTIKDTLKKVSGVQICLHTGLIFNSTSRVGLVLKVTVVQRTVD